jgi:hypothetical protein
VELLSGMLSLAGKFMIGRWMLLLFFSKNCNLSLFKGGVKINCGGFLPKRDLLRSKTSSELYLGQKGEVSLRRVCEGPSLPQGIRSLCGRQRLGKFSLWII